jgi:hypothetical protein
MCNIAHVRQTLQIFKQNFQVIELNSKHSLTHEQLFISKLK